MLVKLGDARCNLFAQRRQVVAERRRRAGLVRANRRAGLGLRSVQDLAAMTVVNDPAGD